jgi:hypothetical protein
VPVNSLSIGTVSALATNGLHALGTDATTGATAPEITKATDLIQGVALAAPQALTIADHCEAIRKEAGNAQAILAAVNEAAAGLNALTVPASPAPDKVAELQTDDLEGIHG